MMRPDRSVVGALVLLTFAAAFVACDKTRPGGNPVSPSSPATVSSVAINGVPASLPVGFTAQLSVVATRRDGTTEDCTSAALWKSSDMAVATISSAGVMTALAPGDIRIAATCGGVSGVSQAHLIERRVTTLAVTAAPTDWAVGDSATLVATLVYSDDHRCDCPKPLSWQSSNPAVVTVSGAGELKAIAPGSAQVAAMCEGFSTAVPVTVPPLPEPPRARLSYRLPGGAGGRALWGITPVTLDATASTGSDLTYVLDFGEGTRTAGPVADRVPQVAFVSTAFAVTAGATVTDRWGRSDTATVTYFVAQIGADWRSFYADYPCSGGKCQARMTLNQDPGDARTVRGSVTWGGSGAWMPVHGRIDGDGLTGSLTLASGDGTFTLTGTYDERVAGETPGALRLTINGGPANGLTLMFAWHEPY